MLLRPIVFCFLPIRRPCHYSKSFGALWSLFSSTLRLQFINVLFVIEPEIFVYLQGRNVGFRQAVWQVN